MLDAVAEGRKRNCFQESSGAFCGNKIVEEGEECDCGYDDQECQENCCYPRNSDELSDDESKVKRCTFRPNAECSPSQGPCCDQQCRFTSIVDDVQCSYEGDCTLASKCDGRAAQCPEPGHKPDNVTECNQGTQVSWKKKSGFWRGFFLIICFSMSSSGLSTRRMPWLDLRQIRLDWVSTFLRNSCRQTTTLWIGLSKTRQQ